MVVEPPSSLLESLEDAIREFHQIRQEISGKPERDQGRRMEEKTGSGTAVQASS
jgi:hypothetical protein